MAATIVQHGQNNVFMPAPVTARALTGMWKLRGNQATAAIGLPIGGCLLPI